MAVFVCPRVDASLNDVLAGAITDASLVSERDSYMFGSAFGIVYRNGVRTDHSRESFAGSGPYTSYYAALTSSAEGSCTLAKGFFRTAHAVFECDGERAWQASHAPRLTNGSREYWSELSNGVRVPLSAFSSLLAQQCFAESSQHSIRPLTGYHTDRTSTLHYFYRGYCLLQTTGSGASAIRVFDADWQPLAAPAAVLCDAARLQFPEDAHYCQPLGFPLCCVVEDGLRPLPLGVSQPDALVLAKARDESGELDAYCYLHKSESPILFTRAAGPWLDANGRYLERGSRWSCGGLDYYIGSEGMRGALGSPPVGHAVLADGHVNLLEDPAHAPAAPLHLPSLLGTPFAELAGLPVVIAPDGETRTAHALSVGLSPSVLADAPVLADARLVALPDGDYGTFSVASYVITHHPTPRTPVRWWLALAVLVLLLVVILLATIACVLVRRALVNFE